MPLKLQTSKFRHVYGNPTRKENCYENIRITKNAHDSLFCAVNPKFMAVVLESVGGGAFLCLPLKQLGRVDINSPKVCGHAGTITDIKWNPFDDQVIASSSDDLTIKLWEIPERGLHINMTQWLMELKGHGRRISYIEWHPTAENVLISVAFDYRCIIWNVGTGAPMNVISCHNDTIHSVSWSPDGSLFATTSKDKKIRVIDPRTGRVLQEGDGHMSLKTSKIVFCKDNRLLSTGFSRGGDREIALWNSTDLNSPLFHDSVDYSSGVLLPYYDSDLGLVYLAGKGDGNIRYFEIQGDNVCYLNQYPTSDPQRSLGWMPKRGLDVTKCEIARFYKLHTNKQIIEPLPMIVPRRAVMFKSDEFQEDIYPPTNAGVPAVTAEEWISGMDRKPVMLSMMEIANRPSGATTRVGALRTQKLQQKTQIVTPVKITQPPPPQNAPASLQNIYKLSTESSKLVTEKRGAGVRVQTNSEDSRADKSTHRQSDQGKTTNKTISNNREDKKPVQQAHIRPTSFVRESPSTESSPSPPRILPSQIVSQQQASGNQPYKWRNNSAWTKAAAPVSTPPERQVIFNQTNSPNKKQFSTTDPPNNIQTSSVPSHSVAPPANQPVLQVPTENQPVLSPAAARKQAATFALSLSPQPAKKPMKSPVIEQPILPANQNVHPLSPNQPQLVTDSQKSANQHPVQSNQSANQKAEIQTNQPVSPNQTKLVNTQQKSTNQQTINFSTQFLTANQQPATVLTDLVSVNQPTVIRNYQPSSTNQQQVVQEDPNTLAVDQPDLRARSPKLTIKKQPPLPPPKNLEAHAHIEQSDLPLAYRNKVSTLNPPSTSMSEVERKKRNRKMKKNAARSNSTSKIKELRDLQTSDSEEPPTDESITSGHSRSSSAEWSDERRKQLIAQKVEELKRIRDLAKAYADGMKAPARPKSCGPETLPIETNFRGVPTAAVQPETRAKSEKLVESPRLGRQNKISKFPVSRNYATSTNTLYDNMKSPGSQDVKHAHSENKVNGLAAKSDKFYTWIDKEHENYANNHCSFNRIECDPSSCENTFNHQQEVCSNRHVARSYGHVILFADCVDPQYSSSCPNLENNLPRHETVNDSYPSSTASEHSYTERLSPAQIPDRFEWPVQCVSAQVAPQQKTKQPQTDHQYGDQKQKHRDTGLSNDQLHKAYFKQVEEIKQLRASNQAKDKQIEMLEKELLQLKKMIISL